MIWVLWSRHIFMIRQDVLKVTNWYLSRTPPYKIEIVKASSCATTACRLFPLTQRVQHQHFLQVW